MFMWEHRFSLSKGTLWRDGHFRNRTTGAWTKTVPPLVFPGRKTNAVDGVYTLAVAHGTGEPQQDISTSLDFPDPFFFGRLSLLRLVKNMFLPENCKKTSIKASPTPPFCRLIILQTTPSLGWQSEIWLSRMKSNRKSPEVYTTQQN